MMPEIPVNVDVQSSNDETLEWVRYEACCAVEGVPFTAPEVWPHLVKRFIAATADAAEVTALRQQVEDLQCELEELTDKTFPKSWAGFKAFIDEVYPDDIFPDDDRDLGPQFVVAARRLTEATLERDALQARLDAVVALCDEQEGGWLGSNPPHVLTVEVRTAARGGQE